MRYPWLVLMVIGCGRSEPPPFVAHPLYLEGMPRCPGAANGYRQPILVKVTEPDRPRTTKDVFFDAPDRPYQFTVDRSKHAVEVAFGICAEPFDAKRTSYSCEAKTVRWYATSTVDIDPAAARNTVLFAPPPQPIACLTGTAKP